MGARGPAPQPTALKVLAGNPSRRPLKDQPRPRPERPECPAWLPLEAKREWARVVPELERLGLIARLDRTALAVYCALYARWRQAEEILERDGLSQQTNSGYLAPRPEVAISQKLAALLRSYCQEFGLSPSARGRMHTSDAQDDDGPSAFD